MFKNNTPMRAFFIVSMTLFISFFANAQPPQPNEPGYYQQWFNDHKNEQGIIPEGMTERWFQHDLTRAIRQSEGESPITVVEQSAPTSKQGGRTRAILIDQRDSSKMWAGAVSGGLWRSTNGGLNWTAINDGNVSLSVTALVQNPLKPNEMYYGTGETRGASQGISGAGIYKSIDNGLTFNKLASTDLTDMRFTNYMAHSLKDSNTVYVGTTGGLYISNDGGTIWTKMMVQATTTAGSNNGLIEHPNGALLATIQNNGIFRRAKDSVSFVKILNDSFPPTTNLGRVLIANCKAFPNIVYAFFCGADYNLEGNLGLFKSTDFGATWTKLADGKLNPTATTGTSYQAYCQVLGVHPVDTNRVVLGCLQVKRTLDGGKTFLNVGYGHSDNHVFVNVGNSNAFFMGNDGGLYLTDWSSTTSTNMNGGYITQQYYAGNYAPRGKIAAGGLQDNGTFRHRADLATTIFGGDGGYTHISLQDSTVGYVSNQNGPTYRMAGFMSSPGASSATPPTAAIGEGVDFINQFEMNYADGRQLYYRTAKALWRTINGGTNWTRLNNTSITGISAVGVTNQTNPSVYIGGANCFWRADSAATRVDSDTLTDLRLSVPTAVRAFSWGTISNHPTDSTAIYVGMTTTSTQPRAWRVRKATTSDPIWESITGDLASTLPIYQVQTHPEKPDSVLLAATAFGLYYSSDSGKTWQKETRVPNVPIFEMKLRTSDNMLFLFTHGRGVFFLQLKSYTQKPNGVREVAKVNFEIFPNPTADVLTIDSDAPLSKAQIFDPLGRERLSSDLQSGQTIRLDELPTGLYLLKVFDKQGHFSVKQFIKE